MKAVSLFQEIDITMCIWEPKVYPSHKHNFFELFYILNGEGIHWINDVGHKYKAGDLFVMVPGDVHHLEVNVQTRFYVLLFNKLYFKKRIHMETESVDFSNIFSNLEFLMKNAMPFEQPLFTDVSDHQQISHIMELAIKEFERQEPYFEVVLQSSVLQILCLIGRKARKRATDQFLHIGNDPDIAHIIFYIQDNIYEPEKLKVTNLAKHFNKSRSQFSMLFKSITGHTTKDYILRYKLELIKNKLEFSNMSISEIAYKLGFTDENHLNKFIKMRLGNTASQYRKLRQMRMS
jgi:AraC-like DNA-binding protein